MKFLASLALLFLPYLSMAQAPGVNVDYNWNNFRFVASTTQAVEWKLGRVYYNDAHWGRYPSIKFSLRGDHYSSGEIEYLVTVHPGAAYITCTKAIGQRQGIIRMILGPETSTGTSYSGQVTHYRDILLQIDNYATCMVQASVNGYVFAMDKSTIGSGEYEYCTLFSSTTPTSPAPANFGADEKKIGMGTVTPTAKLHIYKSTTINSDLTLGIDGPTASERAIGFYDAGTLAWWFGRDNNNIAGLDDGIGFYRNGLGTAFVIKDNGQVTIGNGTPHSAESKLSVKGLISAQKVKVTQTGWADFVFERDYRLPSLQELEQYINQHKHLPEIPSATEVEKVGIDLGEMNKKLLQKIEELTLHLIEQNKRLEALEKENMQRKK